MNDKLLDTQAICKTFPGVRALDNASLTVDRGEVHGVLGENGAGKSTLMKVLTGAVQPDTGRIEVDGQLVDIQSPQDAHELGIGMFYQELSIFGHRGG